MTDESEPWDYGNPPRCRGNESDECRSFPVWEVESQALGETWIDYVCGRHLMAFLGLYVGYGQVTLNRRRQK
jgi:hypothetical protein